MRKHKLLLVLIALGLTWAGIATAQDKPLEEQLVDALTKVFGAYPGFRTNHAKGTVVEGSFKASPEAAGLSRAVLFNGNAIPVTVRFSDATGIPTLPDGSGDANQSGRMIHFRYMAGGGNAARRRLEACDPGKVRRNADGPGRVSSKGDVG